jgi:hypothetical protein
MKSFIQAVSLIAVLVLGVFGLTFLTQYTRKPVEAKSTKPGEPPDHNVMPLRVPEKIAVWDPADPSYAAEVEKGTKGHYDFWPSNPHDKPLTLSLISKSCTCADVRIALLPPADWAAAKKTEATLATALHLVGAPDWAVPLALTPLPQKLQFTQLLRDRSEPPVPFTVPAADAQAGPQIAILRLGFDAKEVKAMRLSAEIQHTFGNSQETTFFEVPIVIVPPVMESNNTLAVGELRYGERRETRLVCWSATRDDFPMKVEPVTHDPCIVIDPPRPLTPEERLALPGELQRAGLISTQTRVRSGYAVRVTVYEHRDGHQLELGPLSRRLVVNPGSDAPVNITLTGVVRGGIQVGDANARDHIDLGSFRADRPKEKTVIITSTEPGIRLKVAGQTPDVLQAELQEVAAPGARQWKLRVGVPPDTLAGVLPPDSAVYLQTLSDPPRRIRIPVTGIASR